MLRKAVGGYLAGASTKSSPASCSRPPTSPGAGGARATHHRRAARRGPRRRRLPADGPEPRPPAVHADSLGVLRPRTVGAEHAGLWAMGKPALPDLPERLCIAPPLRAAAVGSIIARMAYPGSECAARRRLAERSALGELPGTDFETGETFCPFRLKIRFESVLGLAGSHGFRA